MNIIPKSKEFIFATFTRRISISEYLFLRPFFLYIKKKIRK